MTIKKQELPSQIDWSDIDAEQADAIAEMTKEMLGSHTSSLLGSYGVNVQHIVRFQYISRICQKARKLKKLTIKKVSAQSKIPQYRLKAIENCSIVEIRADDLDKYIEFLDIEELFKLWLKKNKDVYEGAMGAE